MAKYKKLGSVTLFDAQNTKEELSKLGNPLERLSQVVDFEMFRKALEDLWNDNSNKKKQKDIDARWTQKGGQNSLTEEQKKSNRKKSSIRSRVEQVFGFMEQTMHGLIFRGVGIVRAKANIAMTNLVNNMRRLGQVVRLHKDWITAN